MIAPRTISTRVIIEFTSIALCDKDPAGTCFYALHVDTIMM